jgi:large subunit ribosomal protein L21
MFAIIETGGKQYRVQEGDKIIIEKLDLKPGEKVIFEKVLLIENNGQILFGNPYLPNAKVEGTILAQIKGEKVIIFKKKRKKGYKKKRGHRQKLTEVQIEKIISDYQEIKQAKKIEVEAKSKEEKKVIKKKTSTLSKNKVAKKQESKLSK